MFIFVSQGTSFHKCKQGDILLKVVSLLKVKTDISYISSITCTTLFD